MIYNFKTMPFALSEDKLIATALTGVVYTENNRLHIKTSRTHYVYKFDGAPIGWYMRNLKTFDDIYLGQNASPTAELENITINDQIYWNDIILNKI